jgi:hypothetical protein
VPGVDLVVMSKPPVQGWSENLVSDRHGHWIAYLHPHRGGKRRLIGHSQRGFTRLARGFI